jgi:hypothetical protein
MVGALATQLKVRHAPEFLVNERKEIVEGFAVAFPPYLQQSRDFARRRVSHVALSGEPALARSVVPVNSGVNSEKR